MVGNRRPGSFDPGRSGPTRRAAVGLILGAPLLGACSGSQVSSPFGPSGPEGPAGPQQQPVAVGTGQVKVGLILPLSAAGNAGVAAQSMKNAAEMVGGRDLQNHGVSDALGNVHRFIARPSQVPFEHIEPKSAQDFLRLDLRHLSCAAPLLDLDNPGRRDAGSQENA